MSYFRNVQLDGKWEAGGTYTFEVYEDGNIIGEECGGPNTVLVHREELQRSPPEYNLNDILFDNNNENADNPCEGITAEREECEDAPWYKYTVTLSDDFPDGTYYFKHRDYEVCEVFG